MSTLDIEIVPILEDNYAYLLHAPGSGTCAVVDPGEALPVLHLVRTRGLQVAAILSTHHHGDHVAGNLEVKAATGAKVYGPAAEADRIPGVDVRLAQGDTVRLGDSEAQVLATPGHTNGHISYWFERDQALFPGDTLFAIGCGRILEGNAPMMWASLQKLLALPDATRIFCGHEYTRSNARFALTIEPGNEALRRRADEVERLRRAGEPTIPSTLGLERATNPFLRPGEPAIRALLGLDQAADEDVFAEIRRRKDNA